jgi:hypothetical protein
MTLLIAATFVIMLLCSVFILAKQLIFLVISQKHLCLNQCSLFFLPLVINCQCCDIATSIIIESWILQAEVEDSRMQTILKLKEGIIKY